MAKEVKEVKETETPEVTEENDIKETETPETPEVTEENDIKETKTTLMKVTEPRVKITDTKGNGTLCELDQGMAVLTFPSKSTKTDICVLVAGFEGFAPKKYFKKM